MVDLYGNIYNFVDHKVQLSLILKFYALQLPIMLVLALPATILVSSIWTLLNLNRRSELVAFLSGGMSPMWLFVPFILFTAICAVVLAYDLSGPAVEAQNQRDMILQQVKGQDASGSVFHNTIYVDNANRRTWFFQTLDVGHNKGHGVELLFRDDQKQDLHKYFAREAVWNKEFWKFTGVREIIYANDKIQIQDLEQVDLPEVTTPPRQLSLANSQADQMTLSQLSQFIANSTGTQDYLATFRTEWWYRVLQPFSLFILLLYAFLNGMHNSRRGAAQAWAWAIIVLILYMASMAFFTPFGRFNRMPPVLSVLMTQIIFGVIGLHLIAIKYGWYWQVMESWKKRRGSTKKEAVSS